MIRVCQWKLGQVTVTASTSRQTTGNWIYRFQSFGDVASALKVNLRLSGPLRRAALAENVCHEIESNLQLLASRGKDSTSFVFHDRWLSAARKHFSGNVQGSSNYPGAVVKRIGLSLLLHSNDVASIGRRFLDRALESGEFLEYDVVSKRMTRGADVQAMTQLSQELDRLKQSAMSANAILKPFDLINDGQEADKRGKEITLDNMTASGAMSLHDRMYNAIQLSARVYHLMRGEDVAADKFPLWPVTPFPSEIEKLDSEKPTLDQIKEWLRSLTGAPSRSPERSEPTSK